MDSERCDLWYIGYNDEYFFFRVIVFWTNKNSSLLNFNIVSDNKLQGPVVYSAFSYGGRWTVFGFVDSHSSSPYRKFTKCAYYFSGVAIGMANCAYARGAKFQCFKSGIFILFSKRNFLLYIFKCVWFVYLHTLRVHSMIKL